MDRNLDVVKVEQAAEEQAQASIVELSQIHLAIVGGGCGEVVFG
jgi:hypothetical protein